MKWTAYALGGNRRFIDDVNNIEAPVSDNSIEDQPEDQPEEEPEEEPEEDPEEDPIAASCGHFLDANDSIWDPRLYWLRNLEKGIGKLTDDWTKILYHMENSTKSWVESPLDSDEGACADV